MRELLTARLKHKISLSTPLHASGAGEAVHLTFELEALHDFAFQTGQFVSCVAEDPSTGKLQTRAYSLASAPAGNRFELCLNRVHGGFFSNLLCNLDVGAAVQVHGPHGYFTLQPEPSHALMISAGTGIAPIRGFLQQLFPQDGEACKTQVWLVQGPDLGPDAGPDASAEEGLGSHDSTLYYGDEFAALAARHANFHYHGAVGDVLAKAAVLLPAFSAEAARLAGPDGGSARPRYAYICGLRAVVNPMRKLLLERGWARQEFLSERYD